MAKIKLIVSGTAVGVLEVETTLPVESSDRLLAYLARSYGKNAAGEDRTPTEMVQAFWDGIVSSVGANVERSEKNIATQAAAAAVPAFVTE